MVAVVAVVERTTEGPRAALVPPAAHRLQSAPLLAGPHATATANANATATASANVIVVSENDDPVLVNNALLCHLVNVSLAK